MGSKKTKDDFLATAKACANIAFVKYWGRSDDKLFLPVSTTNSVNLGECYAITTVHFDPKYSHDEIVVKAPNNPGEVLEAADNDKSAELYKTIERLRKLSQVKMYCRVESRLNFPFKAGIASSAAGVCALVAAVSKALGLKEIYANQRELSRQVRLAGSVSAARSVLGGFTEAKYVAKDKAKEADCYTVQIAAEDHWDLLDIVAVTRGEQKKVSTSQGHLLAPSSPLWPARIASMPKSAAKAKKAIKTRDFQALAEISEADWLSMHAIMMTSRPGIFYLTPSSWEIFYAMKRLREEEGVEVFTTFDAGPNPHIITTSKSKKAVEKALGKISGIEYTIVNHPGPGVCYLEEHLF